MKRKGSSLIIVSVLIGVLITGFVVWVVLQRGTKAENMNQGANQSATTTNKSTNTANANSSVSPQDTWKVFQSPYQFSLSYPDGWSVQTYHSQTGEADPNGYETRVMKGSHMIIRMIYKSSSIDEFAAGNGSTVGQGHKDIIIDGQTESEVLAKRNDPTTGKPYTYSLIFLKRGDVQYGITIGLDTPTDLRPDDIVQAEKIISTLDFPPLHDNESTNVSSKNLSSVGAYQWELPANWKNTGGLFYDTTNPYANNLGGVRCPYELVVGPNITRTQREQRNFTKDDYAYTVTWYAQTNNQIQSTSQVIVIEKSLGSGTANTNTVTGQCGMWFNGDQNPSDVDIRNIYESLAIKSSS